MTESQTQVVKNLIDAIFMMRTYWSQVSPEVRVQLWQQVLDMEDAVDNAGIDENTFSTSSYEALGALQTALEPFRNDWDWEDGDAQNALWEPVSTNADLVNAEFEFGGNGQMSTDSAPAVVS